MDKPAAAVDIKILALPGTSKQYSSPAEEVMVRGVALKIKDLDTDYREEM